MAFATASAALGLALPVAGMALTAIERLDDARDINKSSSSLRSKLQGLQNILESVAETYASSIQVIGDDGSGSDRKLKDLMIACRRPCQQINDILISIKTATFPKLKAGREVANLQHRERDLESAVNQLSFFMQIISERRALVHTPRHHQSPPLLGPFKPFSPRKLDYTERIYQSMGMH